MLQVQLKKKHKQKWRSAIVQHYMEGSFGNTYALVMTDKGEFKKVNINKLEPYIRHRD